MSGFELDPIATDAYTFAHGETLFTHMKMIDNLLPYFNISFEDFVVAPKKALEHTKWEDYERLVNQRGVEALSASGACTTVFDFDSISFQEGLVTCLWEIAESADLITLFRFTNDFGKRWTRGLIRWVIKEDGRNRPGAKYLVLSKYKADEQPDRVVWREGKPGYQEKKGTMSTDSEA
ncbi:uncharacterized protein FTJAE_8428 [Fusarium tjaetaba]|uniref:Uncharacterized protein n=1 Tax=Fusarium tjaetaba TaxID=1567544 RepID=A0A8H5RB46_9HYPO|nr:uncharacterized protein FTJAE_8428 [Fusarium tjaetaba]KAF5629783.1 hypothetical protein FTJAE_8428 [Fusarium tjaetaba]